MTEIDSQKTKTMWADQPINCFSLALSHFLDDTSCMYPRLSYGSSSGLRVKLFIHLWVDPHSPSEWGLRRCDVTTWQEMNEDLACASFTMKLPSSHSSPSRHTLLLGDLFYVSNVLYGDEDASELGSWTNPMPSYDGLWYNDDLPTFACITVYLQRSE